MVYGVKFIFVDEKSLTSACTGMLVTSTTMFILVKSED